MRRSPLARHVPLRQRSQRPAAVERRRLDAEWRRETLAKYGGICVLGLPGCWGRATDPMHGYNKTVHPEYRHEPWVGIPGCRPCHRRADNTPELQVLLQQIADEQQRWHLFERAVPLTVAEIRAMVTEALHGG